MVTAVMEVLRFGDEEAIVFEAGYWNTGISVIVVEGSAKEDERPADYSPIREFGDVGKRYEGYFRVKCITHRHLV